jgi:hypothetical protein
MADQTRPQWHQLPAAEQEMWIAAVEETRPRYDRVQIARSNYENANRPLPLRTFDPADQIVSSEWLEGVNHVLRRYDAGELDVRGVAAALWPGGAAARPCDVPHCPMRPLLGTHAEHPHVIRIETAYEALRAEAEAWDKGFEEALTWSQKAWWRVPRPKNPYRSA